MYFIKYHKNTFISSLDPLFMHRFPEFSRRRSIFPAETADEIIGIGKSAGVSSLLYGRSGTAQQFPRMEQTAVEQIGTYRGFQVLTEKLVEMIGRYPQITGDLFQFKVAVSEFAVDQLLREEKCRFRFLRLQSAAFGSHDESEYLVKYSQLGESAARRVTRSAEKFPEKFGQCGNIFSGKFETNRKFQIVSAIRFRRKCRIKYVRVIGHRQNVFPAPVCRCCSVPVEMDAPAVTCRKTYCTVFKLRRNDKQGTVTAVKTSLFRYHPAAAAGEPDHFIVVQPPVGFDPAEMISAVPVTAAGDVEIFMVHD